MADTMKGFCLHSLDRIYSHTPLKSHHALIYMLSYFSAPDEYPYHRIVGSKAGLQCPTSSGSGALFHRRPFLDDPAVNVNRNAQPPKCKVFLGDIQVRPEYPDSVDKHQSGFLVCLNVFLYSLSSSAIFCRPLKSINGFYHALPFVVIRSQRFVPAHDCCKST